MPRTIGVRQHARRQRRIGALATALALTATLLAAAPAAATETPAPIELTPPVVAPEAPSELPAAEPQTSTAVEPETTPPTLSAIAFPVSFAFDRDVLGVGETVTGYFNGDPSLTLMEIDACGIFSGPGLSATPQRLTEISVSGTYAMFASMFIPGDEIWAAFYPVTEIDGAHTCDPWSPGMGISDSFTLATPVISPDTPSETNPRLLCDWGSSESVNYQSTDSSWWSFCMTDGSISDASTASKSDAFDGVGYVVLTGEHNDLPWEYTVTADALDDYRYTPGHLRFTDNDIQLPGRSGLIDVTVDVRIVNSWATWTVFAVEAGTATPAVVAMAIEGNLGSDNATRWTPTGPGVVSDDSGSGSDPSVIHAGSIVANGARTLGTPYPDNYRFAITSSSFTYAVGLLDYCGTADDALPTATAIAGASAAHLGTSLAPVISDNCLGVDSPLVSVRAGEAFDVTAPITVFGPWDTSAGFQVSVDYDDLPTGVNFEILGEGTPGVAPSIRLHGLVDDVDEGWLGLDISAGLVREYVDVRFQALDGPPAAATIPEALAIDLNVEIGDLIAGTPATFWGEGLQPGASWSVVVRSTPIEIARGIVNPVGEFTVTASIPGTSLLGAGWHSVTVSSTSAAGAALSRVLYFQMDANGTLLAVSTTAPADAGTGTGTDTGTPAATRALPFMGAEPQSAVWIGALLLALGLALTAAPTALRRIRRA